MIQVSDMQGTSKETAIEAVTRSCFSVFHSNIQTRPALSMHCNYEVTGRCIHTDTAFYTLVRDWWLVVVYNENGLR